MNDFFFILCLRSAKDHTAHCAAMKDHIHSPNVCCTLEWGLLHAKKFWTLNFQFIPYL